MHTTALASLLMLAVLLAFSAAPQAAHPTFPQNESQWVEALTAHPGGPERKGAGQVKGLGIGDDRPRAGAKVHFDFDSATVRADANPVLDALGRALGGTLAEAALIVEGHTDARGPADYNLRLSRRRAEAVRRYLIRRHGIAPERLQTSGYGETRPIADNADEAGRALNRRVEFVRVR